MLSYGIMGGVLSVPAGYSLQTILSYSNQGVNAAFESWGDKLLQRYQKSRDVSFSDFTTNYLGFSTDNGAYYVGGEGCIGGGRGGGDCGEAP